MKISFKRIFVFISWLFCLVLLVVVSVRPSLPMESLMFFPNSDKLYHGLYYGIMTFGSKGFLKSGRQIATLGIFLVVLGILLEFIQGTIPGRTFSFADMLANTMGVAAGLLVLYKMKVHDR